MILSIDGTSTADITMEEVLKILRGPKDTNVNLIIRRGKTSEFPVTLVRAIIEVPTVKYGMINNGKQKTGYIRIIEFTPKTPSRVQEALNSFKEASFDSLIIDLRNNPGGLITSVVEVADKLLPACFENARRYSFPVKHPDIRYWNTRRFRPSLHR